MRYLEEEFYTGLFVRADGYIDEALAQGSSVEKIRDLLAQRGPDGFTAQESAYLLVEGFRGKEKQAIRQSIIEAARALRKTCFGNRIATMVPIELTSYCASTCKFCGWRADNKEMPRLQISPEGLKLQIQNLLDLGFSHFELSGADDLPFFKSQLLNMVRQTKEQIQAVNPAHRLSICLTPFTEKIYQDLKAAGVDAVLNWQETYDSTLYKELIPSGPKALGVDDNYVTIRGGDGWLQRMKAQEYAVRAGLQVGIGVMIGLSPKLEADVLAAMMHARGLLHNYGDQMMPVIFGMPIWNSVPTHSDPAQLEAAKRWNANEDFELVSALYLLALPDRMAWVFPNCRVPMEVQINAALTAGVFTSTTVSLSPGGYLKVKPGEASTAPYFSKTNRGSGTVDASVLGQGEQFKHSFHQHSVYAERFRAKGLDIVSDQSLLNEVSGT